MQGKPRKQEFPLYLLTGLILGIVLGLVYAWRLSPVEVIDTVPASMSEEHKDEFRLLTANAFMTNGDPHRAMARLALLEDASMISSVEDQTQRLLSIGENIDDTRAMATMLEAIEVFGNVAMVNELPTSESALATEDEYGAYEETENAPQATAELTSSSPEVVVTENLPTQIPATPIVPTNQPTATKVPTITPSPTAVPAYSLQSFEMVCDATIDTPLIQVIIQKPTGEQVPGVPIMVIWDEGDNVFYTGLKPSIGLGYADYEMTPGVSYDLHLVEGGEGVVNLTPQTCEKNDGSSYWSGWMVIFRKE